MVGPLSINGERIKKNRFSIYLVDLHFFPKGHLLFWRREPAGHATGQAHFVGRQQFGIVDGFAYEGNARIIEDFIEVCKSLFATDYSCVGMAAGLDSDLPGWVKVGKKICPGLPAQ